MALLLGACEPNMLFTGAGLVTLVATDKTITDHALSLALDRNCSFVRSSRGESFCEPEPFVMSTEHCYRTLGGVTCYTNPDPLASDQRRVADVPELRETAPAVDLGSLDLTADFGETPQPKEN